MSGSLTDDVPGTRQSRELDLRRGRRAKALRSGFVVGALGPLTVVPLYLVINHLQSLGKSAAAIGMASMHMSRMGVY
ncbi:MAG: hypothetical protein ACRDQ1_19555, partial [Sciscionella sp.]